MEKWECIGNNYVQNILLIVKITLLTYIKMQINFYTDMVSLLLSLYSLYILIIGNHGMEPQYASVHSYIII